MPALHVPAQDGTQLSVRVTGRPDGPVVLLCDGIGCDGYIWRYLRPALERRCRVVHFHYRGHGSSERPDDDATLTLEQCARDAWSVLDAVQAERAILIGHSMGVQVILEAAHLHPQRVQALVPICGAFERPLDTFQGSDVGARVLPLLTGALFRFPERLRHFWQRAMVPSEFAFWMATATEINARMIRRDDFLPYLRHMARMDPVVFLTYLQSVADHSARPYLRHLPAPTLVVAGDRDGFTPGRLSAELARLLPDAELCTIPAGSHAAPLELPELVELRLEAFSRRRGLHVL